MRTFPQNTKWFSKPKKFDWGLNLVGYGRARVKGMAKLRIISFDKFKYNSWVSPKNVPSPNNRTTIGIDK